VHKKGLTHALRDGFLFKGSHDFSGNCLGDDSVRFGSIGVGYF